MSDPAPRLVLIGPPGAGKSRLGKRVARLLDTAFVDTDRRIVAAHGPIAEIFAVHGESHFRSLERAEVARALGEEAVVSLGGGAILDPETQERLARQRVALVTVSPEAVAERIADSVRPLVAGGIEDWKRLVESRREIYERLARRRWDNSGRAIDEIAAEMADWVREEER
ncbi:MAG TPA: shikimate kinase [Lacisediminihabitans sp.]|uniref:shikimate kinase n=1 Tax=Lacisediminihabitans sp. TaxID=2787631 RepID=UPI002ED940D2